MLIKIGSKHNYVFSLDLNKLGKLGYDSILLKEMKNESIAVDVEILDFQKDTDVLYSFITPKDDTISFLQFSTEGGAFEITENNIINVLELFLKGELDGMDAETYKDTKSTINKILFTLSEAKSIMSFKNNRYYNEDGDRVIDEDGYLSFINSDKYKALKAKMASNKNNNILKKETKGDKIVKIDFKNKNE